MAPKIVLSFSLLMWFLRPISYANFGAKAEGLMSTSSKASSLHPLRARVVYFHELEGEEMALLLDAEILSLERFNQIGSPQAKDHMVVNVDDYGAKGGGADDTLAFDKAWKVACSSTSSVSLVVPKNKTFLLKPIKFSGPCKSNVSVMIQGTIEASSDTSDWNSKNQRIWLLFSKINHLYVGGTGIINGNGKVWWQKSCKIDKSKPCKDAPTALTFTSCNDLTVENLTLRDSQQIHVEFKKCSNVIASTLNISAPQKSPNTDGIHVSETKNIQITDSTIRTGDDCISIVSGSQGVRATNIVCGPGHGISIGSLGAKKSVAQVSDVTVDKAQLRGTTNGVRIKTWQGGSGYAMNITFQNIDMDEVINPIIIDQNYCSSKKKCKQERSAVKISNVLYKNIKGTSASKHAINFNCSKNFPCSGIRLQDIYLVRDDDDADSFCQYVNWSKEGTVIPTPCIRSEVSIL